METKYITIPFDLERAKRISSGEEQGKIVTRDGRNVRIVCWDVKNEDSILALVEDEKGIEFPIFCVSEGLVFLKSKSNCDLMLSVPEWTNFKDGDVLSFYSGTLIFKRFDGLDRAEYYANMYGRGILAFDSAILKTDLVNHVRYATEEESNKIVDKLIESKDPKAKEYLKRFFGIEYKKEYKFEPKQWVLTRESTEDVWKLDIFSHSQWEDSEECYHYYCVGGWNYECIPYNEETKHLIGTSEDWEG